MSDENLAVMVASASTPPLPQTIDHRFRLYATGPIDPPAWVRRRRERRSSPDFDLDFHTQPFESLYATVYALFFRVLISPSGPNEWGVPFLDQPHVNLSCCLCAPRRPEYLWPDCQLGIMPCRCGVLLSELLHPYLAVCMQLPRCSSLCSWWLPPPEEIHVDPEYPVNPESAALDELIQNTVTFIHFLPWQLKLTSAFRLWATVERDALTDTRPPSSKANVKNKTQASSCKVSPCTMLSDPANLQHPSLQDSSSSEVASLASKPLPARPQIVQHAEAHVEIPMLSDPANLQHPSLQDSSSSEVASLASKPLPARPQIVQHAEAHVELPLLLDISNPEPAALLDEIAALLRVGGLSLCDATEGVNLALEAGFAPDSPFEVASMELVPVYAIPQIVHHAVAHVSKVLQALANPQSKAAHTRAKKARRKLVDQFINFLKRVLLQVKRKKDTLLSMAKPSASPSPPVSPSSCTTYDSEDSYDSRDTFDRAEDEREEWLCEKEYSEMYDHVYQTSP